MSKLYIAFHPSGVVREISATGGDDFLPLPGKNPSTLALRYALLDGRAVDRYPGKTDDEVLATIAAQHADTAATPAQRIISRLAFMERFTDAELASIYAAAKQTVMVEVWMDKLKLASEIELTDARVQSGVHALEDAGLIGQGRAEQILGAA